VADYYVRPAGLPPVNGYSHAVGFSGRTIAVSGQVPLDGEGTLVGASDPAAQTEQVFKNLAAALHAVGAGMQHVVKLTVYLTHREDVDAFRRIRDNHVDAAAPPASSLVIVSGLINPEFRVEIDALAEFPIPD
jgi:enamine deaminase RidA (YjgF/YER057c/UK114 family)